MPTQEFGAGFKLGLQGHVDFMPVKCPVLFPVIEFLLDTVAHYKMVINCYGDVALHYSPENLKIPILAKKIQF